MTESSKIGASSELIGASLEFGSNQNVLITDDNKKWTLSLNIDRTAEELIFKVNLEPEYWLAVGLADDLSFLADVIQWEAGATGYNPEDAPSNLSEEMALRQ